MPNAQKYDATLSFWPFREPKEDAIAFVSFWIGKVSDKHTIF